MRTFTISALLGALVAIPFIVGKRKPEILTVAVESRNTAREYDTNLRYDIDDFLME
jgi:hypothetical protein